MIEKNGITQKKLIRSYSRKNHALRREPVRYGLSKNGALPEKNGGLVGVGRQSPRDRQRGGRAAVSPSAAV